MDNKNITKILKLTSQLMELHEENAFKIRSYTSAIYSIDQGSVSLEDLDKEALQKINGIGKSIAEVIVQLQETGTHDYLEQLLRDTPKGLLEVLDIKGLGPKKIKVLWKELNITSVHELLEACQSGEVAKIKGFGKKTQESIIQSLEFMASNQGKWHYADVEEQVETLHKELVTLFGEDAVSLTGAYARNTEIIEQVEWLIKSDDRKNTLQKLSSLDDLHQDKKSSSPFTWRGKIGERDLSVVFFITSPSTFVNEQLLRSASRAHLLSPMDDGKPLGSFFKTGDFDSQEAAYKEAGLAYVLPELREGQFEIPLAKENKLPILLEEKDLKGILHNHSTYSDGKHTLKEMAQYCQELGYEYLGISDHSRTAMYAGGLDIDKVAQQQEEINSLNKEMAPFRIFSGIESDILVDGSLDYPEDILASFDFIVSSIHSSLNMNRKKATARLITAIENPYTTILGHPTGRLLLRREGYPIDHKAIIDACAENNVTIEINANPWRLDLDWRWVHYAIEKGVMLSINPDAHEKNGYFHMKYGVLVGRKGGLTKDMTLNAMSLKEIEEHFTKRKENLKK
ncbi:DNA polymerase/3'-5' exonuclease PolX [Echinicola strongylocentroti]|uniref:DNA polymerase/3'-5' exonuclease PolX n=1 Tax=Echinicola strongylocentroti TaxID=1795355 RepID=A0A2Z4IH43_9BACT|nr:helix-hairpin-helix domain-containing protein [Echinicola strongylocentroti]AWW29788.1 DNA polymerase/3'-5' exonuclease PolX [Echinicola strongylocentroti]